MWLVQYCRSGVVIKAPVALLSIEITTWNMSVNLYFITSRWRPWGVWVHMNYSHRFTNIKYGNQWNNSTDLISVGSQQRENYGKLIYTLLPRKILPATHNVELNFSHICMYLILTQHSPALILVASHTTHAFFIRTHPWQSAWHDYLHNIYIDVYIDIKCTVWNMEKVG